MESPGMDTSTVSDPLAIRKITTEWVQKQMKQRISEYTTGTSLTVFCGTWNVNNKILLETESTLERWLFPIEQPDIDIFCIGFQEIVELNAVNVAIDGKKSAQKTLYWQDKIRETLSSRSTVYKQLMAKNMVGVLLCMYVKESHEPNIRDVVVGTAAVGALGVMANKCGISCSAKLYDSHVCFVCSHLAAKRGNVLGRNADFHDIIQKTVFSSSDTSPMSSLEDPGPRYSSAQLFDSSLSVLDHDAIVWIGDLNYRIDEELSTDEVFDKVNEGDLPYLLQRDQLNVERAKGTVFQGFEEGVITFPPTYKFQQGTDIYERRKDKKLRAPAWCDRVLWRSNVEKSDIELLSYTRAPLNPSDHKPVTAVLKLLTRQIDIEKEKAVRLDVVRTLDRLENGSAPKVSLSWVVVKRKEKTSPEGVRSPEEGDGEGDGGRGRGIEDTNHSSADVGILKCQERAEVLIRLHNTGKAPAKWYMVPKANESMSAPSSWLSVSPVMGMMLPEQVTEATIAVTMDIPTMKRLSEEFGAGVYPLDEVLILRIDKGRDFFIPVSAVADVDPNFDASLGQGTGLQTEDEDDLSPPPPPTAPTLLHRLASSSRITLTTAIASSPESPAVDGRRLHSPVAPPLHFTSPLDMDRDMEDGRRQESDSSVGAKLKGKALEAKEKAKDAFNVMREKAAPVLENTREAGAKAAQNLKPVTEKATAGFRSMTSAFQKIVPPKFANRFKAPGEQVKPVSVSAPVTESTSVSPIFDAQHMDAEGEEGPSDEDTANPKAFCKDSTTLKKPVFRVLF
eukprot:gene2723-5362_t